MLSSSSIACLSASLGDKKLLSTLQIYILQLADVVRRIVVVLAMYLANSSPISSSWNELNVPSFCTPTKAIQPRPPGRLS